MKELLEKFLERAKQDKKSFRKLKSVAIELQQYELASNLRDIENELFPDSEEYKKAKEISKNTSDILRMFGFEVYGDKAYIIGAAIEAHRKKKDKFSIKDVEKIKVDASNFF